MVEVIGRSIRPDGRVTLPIDIRERLGWPEFVSLEAHPGLPYVRIQACPDKVADRLDDNRPAQVHWGSQRVTTGSLPAKVDNFGRIQIPKMFREHAELVGALIFIETPGGIEVWNRGSWETKEPGDDASGVPTMLSDRLSAVTRKFRGMYDIQIDERGRMSIPPRIASRLGSSVVTVRGFERCISLYPPVAWQALASEISELPRDLAEGEEIRRVFDSNHYEISLDSRTRVVIPDSLRSYAQLGTTAVLLGVRDCLELWSPENFAIELKETEKVYASELEEFYE